MNSTETGDMLAAIMKCVCEVPVIHVCMRGIAHESRIEEELELRIEAGYLSKQVGSSRSERGGPRFGNVDNE